MEAVFSSHGFHYDVRLGVRVETVSEVFLFGTLKGFFFVCEVESGGGVKDFLHVVILMFGNFSLKRLRFSPQALVLLAGWIACHCNIDYFVSWID